jgi:multimeric flavodoxin WrbA
MKTLILNGSTKAHGDVAALLDAFTENLCGEVVTLSFADDITPCVDCRSCWTNIGCQLNDKLKEIYPFYESCDNVVIASPVWFSTLSGTLINVASRFVQPYFAASHFQNIKAPIKLKSGVLILCGGEPGTEQGAIKLAGTLFRQMRTTCVETVISMNTNNLPAGDDTAALSAARQAADKLNEMEVKAI